MALVLNTNISSLMAQNALTTSGSQLSTALEQLSTGLRINTAADDAAGYAIVQGMTSQINGMTQAEQNANDGVSLVQTASGALQEITNDLQSMRSLAVESLNATNSGTDRADLNTQFQQLLQDIDSVAANTQFNGVNLLDGSFQGASFQIGANEGQSIQVNQIADMHTNSLGAYTATSTAPDDPAALVAGDLALTTNGQTYSVGASTAGSAGGQDADSAYAIAAAITAADSGITASASNTFTSTTAPTGGTDEMAGSFTINGATVNVSAGMLGNTGTEDSTNVATAINDESATTGVTASVNPTTGVITLTTIDGRNIDFGAVDSTGTGTMTYATLGLTGGVLDAGATGADGDAVGTIELTSPSSFTVGGTAPTTAGLTAATYDTINSTVATMDVSTVSDSNTALTTISAALQQVATLSAQLGAYQNRFSAAATGLATDITNLTSARSNVQDTDYAAATSQLSQAQILQQAGTAMVAQANEIPQNVLTLLQKLP
jgi:flagellin